MNRSLGAAAALLTQGSLMRRPIALVAVMALGLGAAACTSKGASSSTQSGHSPSAATAPRASTAPGAPLVGRWEQAHTCQHLVDALDGAGLGATAPQVVGDFFPGVSIQHLAHKTDLCAGATPVAHYHFFGQAGQFGSLDQNLNQVDNATYKIINGNTLRIVGDGGRNSTFRYRVLDGDTLILNPVITPAQRREALANPLKWSVAGWMVSVAYTGTTWKRVPCERWC